MFVKKMYATKSTNRILSVLLLTAIFMLSAFTPALAAPSTGTIVDVEKVNRNDEWQGRVRRWSPTVSQCPYCDPTETDKIVPYSMASNVLVSSYTPSPDKISDDSIASNVLVSSYTPSPDKLSDDSIASNVLVSSYTPSPDKLLPDSIMDAKAEPKPTK